MNAPPRNAAPPAGNRGQGTANGHHPQDITLPAVLREATAAILAALECDRPGCVCRKSTANGKGLTHCPAHDDNGPSLSVSPPSRTTFPLLHCFTGCTHKAMLAALRGRGIISRETRFAYGTFVHTREDMPDGSKRIRWDKGAKSTEYLYRADALADLEPGTTVLVTEGETAAEAAVALGFEAVATACGAASVPTREALAVLQGFDVALCPDNDDPGRRHMRRIAGELDAIGIPCRWLDVPDLLEKGDLADYGGSIDDLAALVASAPTWTAPSNAPVTVTYSAAELYKLDIPATKFILQGLIPEGLTILGGKPKTGKSWLVMAIAIAVALGGVALGRHRVPPGDVLYLALEDGPARLKSRLATILQGDAFPGRLFFATDWPRFGEGGAEALQAWINNHPDVRLIIIDTLAKVRPRRERNANPYDEDYEHMAALKAVADANHVAIIVVHHLRKMDLAEDVVDLLSGTLAIAGAADCILILRRSTATPGIDAELHVRGRDIEDADLAMRFWTERASWEIAGDWDEAAATGHRASIRAALADGPLALKELEAETSIEYRTLDKTVRRLVRNGELQKTGRGQYSLQNVVVRNVRNESKNSDIDTSVSEIEFGHSDISDTVPLARPFDASSPHPCADCGVPITGTGERCADCAGKSVAAWKAARR